MPNTIHLSTTTSTNTFLKDISRHEKPKEGTVVYTDYQTAGRGQRGNGWESDKGENLLFSMILYPDTIKANEQFLLSQIISLAIYEVLSQYTDGISIKWPNDIYWHEKKICGILIENSLMGDTIEQSIVGVGININQEHFASNAPNPVSLRNITGQEYNIEAILDNIVSTTLSYYLQVQEGGTNEIVAQYKSSLFRRDGFHAYNDGTSQFQARILNIEPSGMLVLETQDGITRKFAFKEVSYIL